MHFRTLAVVALSTLAGSVASATTYSWNFTAGQPGGNYAINNTGGTFQTVQSTYNNATQRLTFSVTFTNQITKGFTLALNNGPNPNGLAGELALLYFDATNVASPKITAYGYNGANLQTSWTDGNGGVAGNQTPDRIISTGAAGFTNSASVVDASGKRTMTFDINVAAINAFSPTYTAGNPWKGIKFDNKVGIWMHPVKSLASAYGSSGATNGFLTNWNIGSGNEGFFDGTNFDTTSSIPLPPAAWAGLIGLAGAFVVARRRKA
ncbi:MAG: hypothetical protein ACKVW3_12175 [Phycisphaerales bacterium]